MADLRQWLDSLGLGEHANAFEDNAVDFRALRALGDDDLKALGLKLGHRRVLQQALAALDAPTAPGREAASTAARRPRDALAERRQLTVMFCDLVGSVTLGERMDVEDYRDLLARFRESVVGAVGRHAGFIARHQGDGLLAYFGYPRAHEDDAGRAVLAGLEVVSAVSALASGSAEASAVRVGIATGPVIVGDLLEAGDAHEVAALGSTPNLAARLQGSAAPNTVLVSELTARLVEGRFRCEPVSLSLKGFDQPVAAFSVAATDDAPPRLDRVRTDAPTPLIGRQEELSLLLGRWRRACDGEGQAVLLSGEPGVGKSRLAKELITAVGDEARRVLAMHGSRYHQESPLYPVVARLERALTLAADASPESRLHTIGAWLSEQGLDPGPLAPWFAALLAPAKGGADEPGRIKRLTFDALLAWLVHGQLKPALLLVEDAHWLDPSTIELIDELIDAISAQPILLVVVHRPDFRPSFGARAHLTACSLGGLSRREIAALARLAAGATHLCEASLAAIVSRADGLPLFAEELARAVAESAGPRGAAAVAGSDVPATLKDSLTARLDRLGDAKPIAQAASAIGREFSLDLLHAIAGPDPAAVGAGVQRMIAAGLAYRYPGRDEDAYQFKHALVQEAAYESLLRGPRRALHARIAAALQAGYPDVVRTRPEVVARHCTLGGLDEQAVALWREAAEAAMARGALGEAVACFEAALRALGDAGDDAAKQRKGLALRLGLRTALFPIGELDRMYRYLHEAEDLAARLGDDRVLAEIAVHEVWALGFQARDDAAIASAERARAIAARLGDPALGALANTALGWLHLMSGPSRRALAELEAAMAVLSPDLLHERLGQTGVRSVFALSLMALAHASLGEFQPAVAAGERSLAIAREVAHPYDVSYALWCLGSALLAQGEVERATPLLEAAARASRQAGIRIVGAWSLGELGRAQLIRGAVADAVALGEEALELARLPGNQRLTVSLTVYHAEACHRAGALDAAARAATEALQRCRECGYRNLEPLALRTHAQVEAEIAGDAARALAPLEACVALATQLELRPELAHAHLARADVLGALGRAQEAAHARRLAADGYRAMGMRLWLTRAASGG